MNLAPRFARSDEAPLDPIAVARALHARFDIRAPNEIAIELMAWHCGARVLYRPAGSADARVVRAGDRAILAIAESARGTPRARFSIAHELAHFLLHADFDAIARIHGEPRTSHREFKVEREADRFASEALLPWSLAAPMCEGVTPTLDAVGDLARAFDVSLSVAGQKWARNARGGCAYVESRGGVIRRARRSDGFRGVAVERRKLEEGTLALELERAGGEGGKRVHARAWGSAQAGGEIVEECVTLGDGSAGGAVLTWLSHG